MESFSDHFSRLKVVAACYTRAYFSPHHFLADRCSELLYFLSFSFQSHHSFPIRCSKPPSLLTLGVQSHHLFSIWNSKPSYLLSYDIESRPAQFDIQRCQFSIMAFKATISLQLGVQSHHRFSFTMFRVVFLCLMFRDVSSQLWCLVPSSSSVQRSEPHLQLSVRVTIPSQFDVQSHNLFSVWAFEATISFQFYIQSRHIFSVTTFRVVLLNWTFRDVSSQLWHSKPPSPYNFAFRAVIIFQLRRSKSSFSV